MVMNRQTLMSWVDLHGIVETNTLDWLDFYIARLMMNLA